MRILVNRDPGRGRLILRPDMPAIPAYPGVYVEEMAAARCPISGVPTAIAAFVGYTARGRDHHPTRIHGLSEFEREFGGWAADSELSYAVSHFFVNGGREAWVVRVPREDARAAAVTLQDRIGTGARNALRITALSSGSAANGIRVEVDHDGPGAHDPASYRLTLTDPLAGVVERFVVSQRAAATNHVVTLVNEEGRGSRIVRVEVPDGAAGRPILTGHQLGGGLDAPGWVGAVKGDDGTALPGMASIIGSAERTPPTGLYALDRVEGFNLLCLPDATRPAAGDPGKPDFADPLPLWQAALRYCRERRAFLLVDPPPGAMEAASAEAWRATVLSALQDPNAAAYFPRLRLPDPLDGGRGRSFAPCGVMAGLYARTDETRGVWKAPAGTEATLAGVEGLAGRLTEAEGGELNRRGVNCFRTFPGSRPVSWGARTLAGADGLGSEWKYVPVRRLGLFLEESLDRGLKWVAFEPNGEPLWAQLRLDVGAFLHALFRQGAFAGQTPREAYLVKCDAETTSPEEVRRGVVNILVGFAPLKPAEFLMIRIRQLAGQPPL